jgi:hypothetical protein
MKTFIVYGFKKMKNFGITHYFFAIFSKMHKKLKRINKKTGVFVEK